MINNFFVMLFMPAIAMAKNEKVIICSDSHAQIVRVPFNKVTTLNFPTSPKEAIAGQAGFDIKRIQQDLLIKALNAGTSTNLIVYLEGRRCLFQLVSTTGGTESYFVRDPKEKTVEVQYVD